MTVLTTITAAATAIGIDIPTAVFAGTTRTLIEVQTYINEAAAMVCFDSGHDWTKLMTLATITGDGATLGFPLPTDYQRMIKKARLWPSATPFAPLIHYTDPDQWLGMQVQQFQPVVGAWSLIGSLLQIRMAGNSNPLSNGDTVKFYYITSKYSIDNSSAFQTAFTADSDTFRLSERLLKLAFIYLWKKGKGQDFSEALADYENVLAIESGNDKGSKILTVGYERPRAGLEIAFPTSLGT